MTLENEISKLTEKTNEVISKIEQQLINARRELDEAKKDLRLQALFSKYGKYDFVITKDENTLKNYPYAFDSFLAVQWYIKNEVSLTKIGISKWTIFVESFNDEGTIEINTSNIHIDFGNKIRVELNQGVFFMNFKARNIDITGLEIVFLKDSTENKFMKYSVEDNYYVNYYNCKFLNGSPYKGKKVSYFSSFYGVFNTETQQIIQMQKLS